MSQPHGYVNSAYLQAMADLLKRNKQRSYEWMRVQRGQRVLDVGCGPGMDTLPLAHLVGPTGQVVGLDADPAMVAEANQRARAAGVDGWVTHEEGDATLLSYASDSFDACRSERLFQHLHAAPRALAEMVRVTKGGGWVVVLDTDWGSLSWDSPEVDIERRLARVRAEHYLANGYAGRQLYRLAKEQQLNDIQVDILPTVMTDYSVYRSGALLDEVERHAVRMGAVTDDELQRWHGSLEDAAARGTFFGTGSSVLVAGRKG